jgi:hypothetical protein
MVQPIVGTQLGLWGNLWKDDEPAAQTKSSKELKIPEMALPETTETQAKISVKN